MNTVSWQFRITSSVKWCFLSNNTGTFVSYGNVEFWTLPLQRKPPSSSSKTPNDSSFSSRCDGTSLCHNVKADWISSTLSYPTSRLVGFLQLLINRSSHLTSSNSEMSELIAVIFVGHWLLSSWRNGGPFHQSLFNFSSEHFAPLDAMSAGFKPDVQYLHHSLPNSSRICVTRFWINRLHCLP